MCPGMGGKEVGITDLEIRYNGVLQAGGSGGYVGSEKERWRWRGEEGLWWEIWFGYEGMVWAKVVDVGADWLGCLVGFLGGGGVGGKVGR